MPLGPVPDYLKLAMRQHFLAGLKNSHSLETYELDLFRWFKTETEGTWALMDGEEQRYVQQQVALGSEDINDSGILATDYYRKRMRSSHVIFLASLLEGAMKRECDRLSHVLGEQAIFKPSDLKGDPWSARRIFLERYAGFEIPADLWRPIKDLLAVRNALVHHSGDVLLLTQEQVSALGKIHGVYLSGSEVVIDETYVDRAIDSVRDIMELLHSETNALIDRTVSQSPDAT
ncbi:hypothetical protein [Cognatiluteimonas weifangensis]